MNTDAADAEYEAKMDKINDEYETVVKGRRSPLTAAEKAAYAKFRTDQAAAMREYNTAIGRDYYIFNEAGEYVDIAP